MSYFVERCENVGFFVRQLPPGLDFELKHQIEFKTHASILWSLQYLIHLSKYAILTALSGRFPNEFFGLQRKLFENRALGALSGHPDAARGGGERTVRAGGANAGISH